MADLASSSEAADALPPPAYTPALGEWQQDWTNALPELEAINRDRRRKGPVDVAILRASQLDAGRLDVELTSMLREQFMKIFRLFQPRVISQLQPELTLLLDFMIFRCSVWAGKPTPGNALMNLRYRNERARPEASQPSLVPGSVEEGVGGRSGIEGAGPTLWQRGLYGLGAVLTRYIWARVDQQAAARHWGDLPPETLGGRLWGAAQKVEAALKLASLVNFAVFLAQGRYRSLLERVLGMRLVYSRAVMVRALSFEYLNRQLVWHEVSTLLLFVLPLVNVAKLKALVLARLPRLTLLGGVESSGAAAGGLPGQQGEAGVAGAREEGTQPCPICGTREIVTPFQALPCRHRHCYYCLRAATQADTRYACQRCGVRVEALQRWHATS